MSGPVTLSDAPPAEAAPASAEPPSVEITDSREARFADHMGPTRVLLLGGVPFGEPVVMWWDFVARSHEEIDRAYADWSADGPAADGDRFGRVASPLPPVPVGPPAWQRG